MTSVPSEGPQARVLEQRLSRERLSTYLAVCGGDLAGALRLYEWNTRVSGACWETIGHVEVALRNAVDERLTLRHTRRGRPGTWLEDPGGELSERTGKDIAAARGRVLRKGKPLSQGQVVSELPFGFWRFLISKRYTNLWPDLAGGFGYAPDRSLATVEGPVVRLHDFRNRLGHHQRVWSQPIAALHADMLDVLGYIDPVLRAWVEGTSRVPAVLAARP